MAIRQTGKKLNARERARLDRVRAQRDNLFDLGENASRVADLLDVNPKEVKRLRGLATTPIAAEAESPVAVADA